MPDVKHCILRFRQSLRSGQNLVKVQLGNWATKIQSLNSKTYEALCNPCAHDNCIPTIQTAILACYQTLVLHALVWLHETRQCRFIAFASAIYSICVWRGSHCSLMANAIHTCQIYSTTAIKSGCVMVWKVIMTSEMASLK